MHQFDNLKYFSNPDNVLKKMIPHVSKSTWVDETDEINLDYTYLVKGPWNYTKEQQEVFSKGNYIHIDNGYFREKKNPYKRITYNALQQNKLLDVPSDRLDILLSKEILPWKNSGDYILILAPNPGPLSYYTNFATSLEWCIDIKNKLLEHTDRKIFFRFKESAKRRGHDMLNKYLDGCYAVISLQSIGCIETITKGVPTLNLAPSCLDCLYKSKIEMIENLPKPDNRYEWLKTLSYSQFTIKEIKSGYALDTLSEYTK